MPNPTTKQELLAAMNTFHQRLLQSYLYHQYGGLFPERHPLRSGGKDPEDPSEKLEEMNIIELLKDKSFKGTERRQALRKAAKTRK